MSLSLMKPTSRATKKKKVSYQSLTIELNRMWGTEVSIIPIEMMYRFESIYCDLVKSLPGNKSPAEIQNFAILGNAQIIRKTLGWKKSRTTISCQTSELWIDYSSIYHLKSDTFLSTSNFCKTVIQITYIQRNN